MNKSVEMIFKKTCMLLRCQVRAPLPMQFCFLITYSGKGIPLKNEHDAGWPEAFR
jgi:hypothetical protein